VETTFGPLRITVVDIRPGRPLEAFRIVRSDEVEDPVLLNSFRSHYELSETPRGRERKSAVIHMGISMYSDEHVARGTAERFDKLGGFVARLHMGVGKGFNFAHTGHPLHLTVWGDPVKLVESVVDIQPVE
jgi:hypothetical protein